MVILKTCPNCNSYQIVEYKIITGGSLKAELMPGVKVDATLVSRYCQCRSCRLIFQNPRLSDKELDTFYNSGCYRKIIAPPPEGMDKGEENRAEIDSQIIKKIAGEVDSHLDIGCGLGHLLDKIGARLKVGVESDLSYVKFKNIKVFSKLSQVEPKKFDLVTSIHSLEHVPHPARDLKKIVSFVKKDGFVVLEVPSIKTRGGALGFVHLSFFEPDVLRLMCKRVGLKIIETQFTPHLFLICCPDTS